MDAVEFIKKHGLDYSNLFGNGWITFDDGCLECGVDRGEVARLVESHELSDRLGGVETMLIMI